MAQDQAIGTESQAGPGTTTLEAEAPGEFGRLVRIYRSNERHLSELKALAARIAQARQYLAKAGSNRPLGQAQLDRLRMKHSAALVQLRANRIEAGRILGWGVR
jgi:hypothetical protein